MFLLHTTPTHVKCTLEVVLVMAAIYMRPIATALGMSRHKQQLILYPVQRDGREGIVRSGVCFCVCVCVCLLVQGDVEELVSDAAGAQPREL